MNLLIYCKTLDVELYNCSHVLLNIFKGILCTVITFRNLP
jgi:hypothetical protein